MGHQWQADRVRSATTTIFAEMSALAVATGSVNLGQGFPDTDGPDFMLDEAAGGDRRRRQPVPAGPRHPAAAAGRSPRTAERHYGLDYDPDSEVLVTTGATEAIAAALLAFVDPGDEVIALEPFYDSYAASIDLAGGVRVGVGLFGPDFRLDHDELAAAFSPRTKALMINTPHNPTGTVLDRADLAEIARLAIAPRRAGDLRRGVRAPGLRRRRAPAAGHLPRHARTDPADLLGGQDLLGHRLEDRLGPRAGGAGHRRHRGQAVPDLRLRRARSSRPSPGP